MGQNPPIDELQARKRLIQAKMELHRAEMALYCREVLMPIQAIQTNLQRFTDHPIARIVIMGGLGFLAMSGRARIVRRLSGFIIPMFFPTMRRFLMGNAWRLAFKVFQTLRT